MGLLDQPDVRRYADPIFQALDIEAAEAGVAMSPFARDAAATLWVSTAFEPADPGSPLQYRTQPSDLRSDVIAPAFRYVREEYRLALLPSMEKPLFTAIDLVHWLGDANAGSRALADFGPYPKDPRD